MLPIRRWRILWSEALLAFILLVCYSGLVGLAFASTSHRYENILISTPVPAQEIPPAVEVPYPMIPPPDIYPGILDEYPQPYP